MWRKLASVLTIFACGSMAGCDSGPPHRTISSATESCTLRVIDPPTRLRLEQALARSSVTYDTTVSTDGGVVIRVRGESCKTLRTIEISVLGPDLPNGRHIHFGGDHNSEFKKWLTDQGIPFETQVRDGSEYIIWKAEDSARVASWQYFPRNNPAFSSSAPNTAVNPDAPSTRRLP
jgi:hypothetical protein